MYIHRIHKMHQHASTCKYCKRFGLYICYPQVFGSKSASNLKLGQLFSLCHGSKIQLLQWRSPRSSESWGCPSSPGIWEHELESLWSNWGPGGSRFKSRTYDHYHRYPITHQFGTVQTSKDGPPRGWSWYSSRHSTSRVLALEFWNWYDEFSKMPRYVKR